MKNQKETPNLDELGKMLSFMMNNSPVDDFLGYSSAEMENLLYHSLEKNSIVRFKENIPDEVLDKIPMLRIIEFIIAKIGETGELKLTKTGKLPVKVVFGVYGKYFKESLERYHSYNPTREDDVISVKIARTVLELSSVVKKRNNKLSLTRAGEKIAANRNLLLEEIFKTYVMKFNMGFADGYEAKGYGNIGFAFILIMLSMFGDKKRDSSFYVEKYHKAFPELVSSSCLPLFSREAGFTYCFNYRIIELFLKLFNLVDADFIYGFNEIVSLKKTDIFDQVIHIVPSNAKGEMN